MFLILLAFVIILVVICSREGFDGGYSFGFGGWPTARPYHLYSRNRFPNYWQSLRLGYGSENLLKYRGKPTTFPGGPEVPLYY